jgi:hypothetical protein
MIQMMVPRLIPRDRMRVLRWLVPLRRRYPLG